MMAIATAADADKCWSRKRGVIMATTMPSSSFPPWGYRRTIASAWASWFIGNARATA